MTSLDELLALLPDNDTGAIDAVDLRTIVTALWNEGADVAARVSALEEAGGGTALPSVSGRWQVNPTGGATPGTMQVTASSGEWALATWLRFAKVDQNNNDLTNALLNTTSVFGQMQSDASNWGRWDVSGAATDGGSYIQIPVTYVRGDGSIVPAGWQHAVTVLTLETP